LGVDPGVRITLARDFGEPAAFSGTTTPIKPNRTTT
jgi:hypothetical protein